MKLQLKLKAQEDATAEQSSCSQKLQEAVEIGKGKLAESAAYVLKLQDEQSRAKEQISEYATQVRMPLRVMMTIGHSLGKHRRTHNAC